MSGTIDVQQDSTHFEQEHLAGFSQLYAVGGAIKERDAEFSFQAFDLLGEWRLRNIQQLRRTGEIQLLGYRHEIPQVP